MTATEQAARTYTVSEILALTGAKYRFIDYAIRAGYLDNDTANGSGSKRMFTEAEADTIYAAVNLIAAGLTVAKAFDVAKRLVTDDGYTAQVGHIYQLSITVRVNTNPTEETP